ncbi:solute carrier family 25 member 43 isoform X2 [Ictalurus punctatus]|uniref:Solute carrier family 25 member 43 isoform X2 n=1 Tax=Ictalurus punctatus TaxID=7998 RepID=A0A2D0RJ20_ICTPU|nr:solute carrier family 25 member 43 isoform X2 [Ictalurus punctatus]
MATVIKDDRLTNSQSFLCVGFAGIFSKTFTSPLEVVKILSQVGTFHCKCNFMRSFLLIYEREGLRAFWKGNSVSCLRLFPYSAIHLGTYKTIIHLYMDELGRISQWKAIMTGSLAGAVPFSIGCYIVFINLDKLWQEHHFRFTSLQNFINGCLAAGVAQTLSFPFETIKRKMQAQSPLLPHYGGVDVHFTGMIDCFKQVIKTKGVLSLWSGITANMLKIIPYYGLLFSCFEMCKQFCLYQNGYTVSPLSYKLKPGVDQSLGPHELQEFKRYLRNRQIQAQSSSMGNRWQT